MSEHCIIRADFSATRSVAGRKVLQLIFEVPIEAADDAMARLGGFPLPGENRWCAIALLENGKHVSGNAVGPQKSAPKLSAPSALGAGQTGKQPSHTTATTAAGTTSETQSHDRKPFASLPLSQQAAIRCGDVLFQEYLKFEDEADTARAVRKLCCVDSRSQIVAGSPAGSIWNQLEASYQNWLTDRKFAEAKR